jgi:hypothetical protein
MTPQTAPSTASRLAVVLVLGCSVSGCSSPQYFDFELRSAYPADVLARYLVFVDGVRVDPVAQDPNEPTVVRVNLEAGVVARAFRARIEVTTVTGVFVLGPVTWGPPGCSEASEGADLVREVEVRSLGTGSMFRTERYECWYENGRHTAVFLD